MFKKALLRGDDALSVDEKSETEFSCAGLWGALRAEVWQHMQRSKTERSHMWLELVWGLQMTVNFSPMLHI